MNIDKKNWRRHCIKFIINYTLNKYYPWTVDHTLGYPSKYMTTIYNYFCIKKIFLDFLKVKKLGKYAPKRTKFAPLQIFFGGACPRTLLANAWLRHASQAPPPKKKNAWPPLANPAYAHELLLRNLFENPPWQTVDCVQHVICLCITKSF